MSRRPGAMLAAALMALILSAPLAAQDAAPVTADQAIANAREVYGPPDTRAKPACPAPKPGDEIVVCAKQQDDRNYRVKSSGELDPEGAGAKDNVPRAPDVGTVYPPGQVSVSGCFIPPCPPPMPVLIDLKAIPEAPPGSDADRVANGLAPRGGPDPAPPPAPAVPLAQPAEPAPTPPGLASPAGQPSGLANLRAGAPPHRRSAPPRRG